MADWPVPPQRPGGLFEAAGLAEPSRADDDAPSARILQWPGPRHPVADDEPAGEPDSGSAERDGRPAPAHPLPAPVVPATALLVLWALSCLAPRLPLELLDRLATSAAAWSTLAVVPAVALVGLALRSRSWVVAAAAALAGVLPWVFVATYAVPGEAPAATGGGRLAVLLLDADAGRADPASIVAAALRRPVDVLVVTEATPLLTHDLATAGLDPRLAPRWVSTPDGSAQGGVVVYSRYAVVSQQAVAGTRWPAARIMLDTGRGRVALVVGRASPPGQGTGSWRSDLQALAAAARAGGPAVLAGTLDATPDQAAFRGVTAGGLEDAAAAYGRGLRPTWPSWSLLPVLPLDHVLVGGGIGVRSIGTVPVGGTSHRALVADLVVPPSTAGPTSGD